MEIASHYRQLLRELNEQRQHGILCDACVIVDGKIFKAHKNVLLGSSRYFKTLYCQVRDCYNWEVRPRESVKYFFFSLSNHNSFPSNFFGCLRDEVV